MTGLWGKRTHRFQNDLRARAAMAGNGKDPIGPGPDVGATNTAMSRCVIDS